MNNSQENSLVVKYVDDATAASVVNLKESLRKDTVQRPKPLNYNEHNELILPESSNPLVPILNQFESFIRKEKMSINQSKTKIMTFNLSKNYNFPPEFGFEGHENLEVVPEAKILGVIVCSSLKWDKNTFYIVKRQFLGSGY